MRVIIAGSRGITDPQVLLQALATAQAQGFTFTTILSGGARGADALGEGLAVQYNIPLKRYPADWNLFGRRAGYVRNEVMAQEADGLIALWDGKSKGTKHMIETARKHRLKICVYCP